MTAFPDLTWTVADQSFRLVPPAMADAAPGATLVLPDGGTVSLPLAAWVALRDALHLLSPARRAGGPTNRGQPWAAAMEERMATAFGAGDDPQEIALALGRTRGAVLARLVRLGLMDEATAGLRYPARPAPRAETPAS